jgi:hypothetical protein
MIIISNNVFGLIYYANDMMIVIVNKSMMMYIVVYNTRFPRYLFRCVWR